MLWLKFGWNAPGHYISFIVCAPGCRYTQSIYHASRDRSGLGFYLCCIAESRVWHWIYIYAQEFCRCCHPWIFQLTVEVFDISFATACDRQIHRDDIGDLGSRCFPHCASWATRNGSNYHPGITSSSRTARCRTHYCIITQGSSRWRARLNVEDVSFVSLLPHIKVLAGL